MGNCSFQMFNCFVILEIESVKATPWYFSLNHLLQRANMRTEIENLRSRRITARKWSKNPKLRKPIGIFFPKPIDIGNLIPNKRTRDTRVKPILILQGHTTGPMSYCSCKILGVPSWKHSKILETWKVKVLNFRLFLLKFYASLIQEILSWKRRRKWGTRRKWRN